jgi:multicomponent Na+:H+ antiporter subunit D
MIDQLLMFPAEIIIIIVPLAASLLVFSLPRHANFIGIITSLLTIFAIYILVVGVVDNGPSSLYLGGWMPPLGILLKTDGISLLMIITTGIVAAGVGVYAVNYFEAKKSAKFWRLWLVLWASLNALFISNDLFNFYITIELIGIAAVSLTALSDKNEGISATLRYLILALLGSLFYLLGIVIIYHAYHTLDITLLSNKIQYDHVTLLAFSFICIGLALKSALFPLHFWLPTAHVSAPAPVSAILSALVVKASIFIFVRLSLNLFQVESTLFYVLGMLGSFAVLWGAFNALFQSRLKLIIAYSTIAQVGYLFIALYLTTKDSVAGWQAFFCILMSHACAKAAMFLAAGNLIRSGGSDQLESLDRTVHRHPITTAAFGLAGISIIGLPISGGFVGKWFLLEAALTSQDWYFILVTILGGLFAAGYIFKVLGQTFYESPVEKEKIAIPASMEWAALFLAIAAILVGIFAMPLFRLLSIGIDIGTGIGTGMGVS